MDCLKDLAEKRIVVDVDAVVIAVVVIVVVSIVSPASI